MLFLYPNTHHFANLGGFRRLAPKELDKEGREVSGSRGYKYFGAAKELAGVRELFQQQAEEEGPHKKSRAELVKNIDASYYGYMDEDDGWLIPLEKAEEEKAIAHLNAEWEEKGPEMNRIKGVDDDIYRVEDVNICFHFIFLTTLYRIPMERRNLTSKKASSRAKMDEK